MSTDKPCNSSARLQPSASKSMPGSKDLTSLLFLLNQESFAEDHRQLLNSIERAGAIIACGKHSASYGKQSALFWQLD